MYIPSRGDVVVSKGGRRYVVDHLERNDDDADRYAIRSLQWGVLLTTRYTVDSFRNGALTFHGERFDLDALAMQE